MAKLCRFHIGGIAILLLSACGSAHDTAERADREATQTKADSTGTVVEDGCRHSGANSDGSIQFILTCPQASRSPDGAWTLVQTKALGEAEAYRVYVADAEGNAVGDVPGLADAMPFALFWSPRRDWFAVSHHVGSFMDAPEVYEITERGIVRHDGFRQRAWAEARRRYPCLPVNSDMLTGSIMRWSRDGGNLAWAFNTRIDACMPEGTEGSIPPKWQWEPFLMVSDVETGEIIPGSIRVIKEDRFIDVELPTDGPYAAF